ALTDAELAKIEGVANDQVLASRQVRAKFLARDLAERKFGFRLYQGGSVPGGELRVVEIPKWDAEACGGTHVARTSDVALIKILRSTRIQDGVVRLEYTAGKAAFDAVQKQSEEVKRAADVAGILQSVVPEFRGKGGGKPDFAQASFPNLDQARAAAERLERSIREKLGIPSG